jgi:hypothetical protein
MERSQPRAGSARRRDLWIYSFLILFGIAVIGGIAAFGYYGEEIGVFLQGGWNRGGIARIGTDFVARVQAKDYAGAIALTAPGAFDPIKEGDQVVGLAKNEISYHTRYLFADLYPAEQPRVKSVDWTNADGGSYTVSLLFPNGHESRFLIRKIDGEFRITQFLG